MNARPAGWERDPSGRHEYRYWDGSSWTDDVADQGITSVDPIGGAGAADAPTTVAEPTGPYPAAGGPPAGAYGQPAGGAYGQPPTAPGGYSSGAFPASQPPKSGPSTGLIVGLAALAIAVIVGVVVVLTSGGDDDGDDTTTDDTSETTDETATDDTSTDDTSTDDTTSDTTGGAETPQVLVDMMADEFVASGQLTEEQAQCLAETMLNEIGLERLAEFGANGGDISDLTPEEMSTMFSAFSDCGIDPTTFDS